MSKINIFCHLRYNDYLPLDAAQWVAEVQCEPECIIRNIIDNTFYNKNVVVSNPEQPAHGSLALSRG